MGTQLDFSVGVGKESTYGTAVVPTRFVESEAKLKYDVKTMQGKGLRPGKNTNRLNRNVVSRYEASGDIECDVTTRGFGFLLNAVLGAVTNTVVPATAPAVYQQNHVLSTSDPVPSYTVQEVLPTIGGVNSYAHTFLGTVFDSLELSAKEGGTLEAKFSVTAREMRTDIADTATSYPADDSLFTFVSGAIIVGGTLTEPTTTALASMTGTAAANIEEVSVSIKRNLDSKGWNLGGAGLRSRAPLLGKPELTGKVSAEYIDNTLRDAYLAQTAMGVLLTFTGPIISGSTRAVLQIVIPSIRLKGEVPTSDGGNAIRQSIDFEIFDNGASTEELWVILRTLDTTP